MKNIFPYLNQTGIIVVHLSNDLLCAAFRGILKKHIDCYILHLQRKTSNLCTFMKERLAHDFRKIRPIPALICILLATFFSPCNSHAQWTFSFQLAYSGNCGGAGITLPTIPQMSFPTKNDCESLRQYVLSVSASGGGCTVYYTCTPCTGSDMVSHSQVSPGDVSFNGQNEGKPLFTSHQSAAFEDWAKDILQMQGSFRQNSALQKNMNLPATGDKKFDELYNNMAGGFNPSEPTGQSAQNSDAVDLSGKTGVVQLLTTREEQARRDAWYDNTLQAQGYGQLNQMDLNNPAIVDEPSGTPPNTNSSGLSASEMAGDAIGDLLGTVATTLVPQATIPNFISSFETNLAVGVVSNIQNGFNAINGTGSAAAVQSPGQLVSSSYINTCTVCKWLLTPATY
jgi:hypothetical protein